MENSHTYISGLVENIPKNGSPAKITGKFLLGGWLLLCTFLNNIDKNYTTMINIKIDTLTFILITLEVYTEQDLSMKQKFCISHFLL